MAERVEGHAERRRTMRSTRVRRAALLAALLVLVGAASSCGGGNGGTQGSSNWDQLVWDTDVWA
jgi:hypothetical protein